MIKYTYNNNFHSNHVVGCIILCCLLDIYIVLKKFETVGSALDCVLVYKSLCISQLHLWDKIENLVLILL